MKSAKGVAGHRYYRDTSVQSAARFLFLVHKRRSRELLDTMRCLSQNIRAVVMLMTNDALRPLQMTASGVRDLVDRVRAAQDS